MLSERARAPRVTGSIVPCSSGLSLQGCQGCSKASEARGATETLTQQKAASPGEAAAAYPRQLKACGFKGRNILSPLERAERWEDQSTRENCVLFKTEVLQQLLRDSYENIMGSLRKQQCEPCSWYSEEEQRTPCVICEMLLPL